MPLFIRQPSIGHELLNVPMGDMIRQMASAIADGQLQLDATSIEVAEMMGGLKVIYDEQENLAFNDSRVFFGYDLMTVKQAEAYLAVEQGLNTWDTKPLKTMLDSEKSRASDEKDELVRVPMRLSMLELGFSPTFYQFVDTIIEVKIAIKITRSSESTNTSGSTSKTTSNRNSSGGLLGALFGGRNSNASQVTTSQVDASYSSKYSYSAEGSSLLRTKLVPLPPPPILEERIRRQMDEDVERRKKLLDAQLKP